MYGDQIKYNFLFGKQAGWGVWNSCEKIFRVEAYANTRKGRIVCDSGNGILVTG